MVVRGDRILLQCLGYVGVFPLFLRWHLVERTMETVGVIGWMHWREVDVWMDFLPFDSLSLATDAWGWTMCCTDVDSDVCLRISRRKRGTDAVANTPLARAV